MQARVLLLFVILFAIGCSRSSEKEEFNTVTRNKNDTWTSDALTDGNIEAIRERALDEPTYLESRDFVGDTPLLSAISFDNLELVQFLLQHGADANVKVDDGYTCLLTSVESEAAVSVKIVEALVVAGADIHLAGTKGWTPLHMAAARGHTKKAQILIDAGANVNQRIDIDGEETPLMEAAFMGRPGTVKLLLDNGADASLRDTMESRTSLEIAKYAAVGPDPKVYRLLQKENFQVESDELFDDMDLPADQLKMLKEQVSKVDLAESYLQNSKDIVESGDHAEVIHILSEHKARQ